MFTYNYKQPNEYHFSLDSIHFAEFLAKHLKSRTDLSSLHVLDLCAGCGVIGIELSWYLRELSQIDFVEVQDVYTEHFQQNARQVDRTDLTLRWHCMNYDKLLEKEWANKYNLIISNPPYFLPNAGILSPSQFKNRCRFYLDSSFTNYIQAIMNSLAINGEAYFLLRSLKHHGYDLELDIQKLLEGSNIVMQNITNIRGTDVICLKKLDSSLI